MQPGMAKARKMRVHVYPEPCNMQQADIADIAKRRRLPGGGPTRDRVVADFDASLDRLVFFREFQETSPMSSVTAVAAA